MRAKPRGVLLFFVLFDFVVEPHTYSSKHLLGCVLFYFVIYFNLRHCLSLLWRWPNKSRGFIPAPWACPVSKHGCHDIWKHLDSRFFLTRRKYNYGTSSRSTLCVNLLWLNKSVSEAVRRTASYFSVSVEVILIENV